MQSFFAKSFIAILSLSRSRFPSMARSIHSTHSTADSVIHTTPDSVIPSVISLYTSLDAFNKRKIISKLYSSDAIFRDPLVHVTNRENVFAQVSFTRFLLF
jgi:hypothetical protein